LPSAAYEHQRENALEYAGSGAAIFLNQENLTPSLLINEINQIIDNPALAQKMSANAKVFSRPDAARQVADELISLVSR